MATKAYADNCPTRTVEGTDRWNIYMEWPKTGSSRDIHGEIKQQVSNDCDAYTFNSSSKWDTSGSLVRVWAWCSGIHKGSVKSRPSYWPPELNFCPSGERSKSGSEPPKAATQPPAKAKCSKKDIEGKWQRTSDGTKVGLYGGFGRMVKYFGSINWPMAVGKFYRVKHISGSCDWSARCTTVRMRASSKNYNYSAEPCTLRLSADKNRLTTSDGSGTWTRGWK